MLAIIYSNKSESYDELLPVSSIMPVPILVQIFGLKRNIPIQISRLSCFLSVFKEGLNVPYKHAFVLLKLQNSNFISFSLELVD